MQFILSLARKIPAEEKELEVRRRKRCYNISEKTVR